MAESIVDTESPKVPIAEAMASAMAQQAHQHAAAHGKEEDAPRPAPVQLGLLPRPAFDLARAWDRVDQKQDEIEALKIAADDAGEAAKSAKAAHTNAVLELLAMLRQIRRERAERAAAPPEQLELPHGAECAWEKDHPGQVCAVCHEAREKARAEQQDAVAEQIAADAEAEPDVEQPGVIVERARVAGDVDERPGAVYLSANPDSLWTEDVSLAAVFDTEADAQAWITANLQDPGPYNILPDPMAADPNAAAQHAEPAAAQPAPGPGDPCPQCNADALYTATDECVKCRACGADVAGPPSSTHDAPAEPEALQEPDEPEDPEPAIVVGSIAIALNDHRAWKAGLRAVCYEVYTLEGRPGYSFLFENGFHDGFSIPEVREHLALTGAVCPEVADYEFSNVVNLMRDARKGVFKPAWDMAVTS